MDNDVASYVDDDVASSVDVDVAFLKHYTFLFVILPLFSLVCCEFV
jgi:hypothetical protein